MNSVLVPVLTVVVAVSAACSSANPVAGATDVRFSGTWAQRQAAAGTTFVLTLTANDSGVTAQGTYKAEGGKSGTVTGRGSVSGDRLLLSMTYDDGSLAQFDGTLVGSAALEGALHFGPPQSLTPSAIVAFDRKN